MYVCLSSTLNFAITYDLRYRDDTFGIYTPLMIPFSNDSKVNDLVTLTLAFKLKIVFFVATFGMVFDLLD